MNPDLAQRIRQCPNLPSLPAIAVQVLELAQKDDADIGEIARTISRDPALSGKILRTVNSSFYGRSQNISTISHALVILGLQSVKTLVLGFSLVTSLSTDKPKGFKHLAYWKRSTYAATAARNICAKLKIVQHEEAFLAALLQDIGMLVLDRVMPDDYGRIHEAVTTHTQLPEAERAALGADHAEVGGMMAEQWNLPPLLAAPIAKHHAPEQVSDLPLRRMAEVVALAGDCADVFVDEAPAARLAAVRKIFHERHRIPEAECDALLEQIGKDTKDVASLFEINIGRGSNFEEILKRATEALVEITIQTQRQVTTLREQNTQLLSRALNDGLTGLANRGRFDAFLDEQFAAARASGQPLSLLLLDIDNFKAVNDRHGHPNGDAVLKSLAALLASAARPADLAARYGGEEMALVLPGTNRALAATIAEAVRRAIERLQVRAGHTHLQVTASFGVAALEPGVPFTTPAHLIKAADLSLYAAKSAGRNCVRVFSNKPGAKPAAA